MLAVLKSVAAYLAETTTLDVSAILAHSPNEAQRRTASYEASSVASGVLHSIADNRIDTTVITENTGTQYVGVLWSELVHVGGIRFYWPAGATPPVVKVRRRLAVTWADVAGLTAVTLVEGWNTIRLPASLELNGIRVQYVSGGDGRMRCSEFEVYEDLRVEPAPTDFADGGVLVLHPDLDLSTHADVPLVTVGGVGWNYEPGEVGGGTRLDRGTVVVGVHCTSEDQLDRHVRWARAILGAPLSPDLSGVLYPGIPLRGIRHPLAPVAGGDWWTSGQKGWHDDPAPVVRAAGTIVTPDTIDYWRGRVELVGVADTADVRADFTCGVWDFVIGAVVRAGLESPAQLMHRHNCYLALESDGQYQAVQDALV